MTRITNTEQVLLLLRAQLQRAERKGKQKSTGRSERTRTIKNRHLDRLQVIASDDELPERDLHRALIGGLLIEEFGAAIGNDVSFQSVIDKVVDQIRSDDEGKAMLSKAVLELTSKD